MCLMNDRSGQLYSASQKKTEPWNNGMMRASFGVYDYYHIYFMKYD